MKIPRDISSDELIKNLEKIGYEVTRQKGSHIRLTATKDNLSHHITVPNHNPIKIGTLNSILNDLSSHLKIAKDEILKKYF
ncbi:MAG: type II toxin-antitoxin system HicA family toxin [Ignavibacteria bacterium]|nr:type II toxin-antitoxin system HicA family toxin [Ignavibacteria bacterium]